MGFLVRWGVLPFLLSCSTVESGLNTSRDFAKAQSSDDLILQRALELQGQSNWKAAEQEWNLLAPSSRYFPLALYETQKLSYRLENWNAFFAKAELYKQIFKENLYCPELYLLQAFALTRNCYFNAADESLKIASQELQLNKKSQCSLTSKVELDKNIQELSDVLVSKKKIPSELALYSPVKAEKKNLWALNAELIGKLKKVPIQNGIALVAMQVRNLCEK